MKIIKQVYEILDAIRATNSIKKKIDILTKNKNIPYLEGVLKYCYDTITYTYGLTSKTIKNTPDSKEDSEQFLGSMFYIFETLNCKDFTGSGAIHFCKKWINSNPDDAELFYQILDRDLHLGLNTRSLNKVYPELIPKPKYNRCAVYSEKTASEIQFPAYVQLKCDGTYREAHVIDGNVSFRTRAGEEYQDPLLADVMRDYPNGFYFGELTIGPATAPDANRAEGNGLINSKYPPFALIHYTIWDYLTDDDYNGITEPSYETRLLRLVKLQKDREPRNGIVHLVPTYEVIDLENALAVTHKWMSEGLEGAILKDKQMLFKDGTNKKQLKIKLKVDCEMRITGFTEGTGKRAGKIGAILFENDGRTIQGACSGFSDAEMEKFSSDPDKYIGKIITVQFNDLSKSPENDYFALVHPRFVEIRDDKDETDTLSKVKSLCQMAKNLA